MLVRNAKRAQLSHRISSKNVFFPLEHQIYFNFNLCPMRSAGKGANLVITLVHTQHAESGSPNSRSRDWVV